MKLAEAENCVRDYLRTSKQQMLDAFHLIKDLID